MAPKPAPTGLDHDAQFGCAVLVTDLPSSTSDSLLRRSISFFAADPGRSPGRAGRCCLTRSSLASTSKSLAQLNKSQDVGHAN